MPSSGRKCLLRMPAWLRLSCVFRYDTIVNFTLHLYQRLFQFNVILDCRVIRHSPEFHPGNDIFFNKLFLGCSKAYRVLDTGCSDARRAKRAPREVEFDTLKRSSFPRRRATVPFRVNPGIDKNWIAGSSPVMTDLFYFGLY